MPLGVRALFRETKGRSRSSVFPSAAPANEWSGKKAGCASRSESRSNFLEPPDTTAASKESRGERCESRRPCWWARGKRQRRRESRRLVFPPAEERVGPAQK